MEARDVIVSPRITEKSMANALGQQYSFVVHPDATKTQIRHAVEEIFNVNVIKVNTVNVGGKKQERSPAAAHARKAAPKTTKKPSSRSSRSKDRTRRRELLRAMDFSRCNP